MIKSGEEEAERVGERHASFKRMDRMKEGEKARSQAIKEAQMAAHQSLKDEGDPKQAISTFLKTLDDKGQLAEIDRQLAFVMLQSDNVTEQDALKFIDGYRIEV